MNIKELKKIDELNILKWQSSIIVITVVYGNQDIHIESLRCLSKSTEKETITLVLIDNKGDYDVEMTAENLKSPNNNIQEILYFRRNKVKRREKDAAFNHACALNEALEKFQRNIVVSTISGANPMIMIMDPDFMIMDDRYCDMLKRDLENYHIIGTRWTRVKTHKFHSFPSPHFIATNIENLKKIGNIDLKSRPIIRDASRKFLRNTLFRHLFIYNSYDPGSRMDHRRCKYMKILFIEQYYWRKEIEELLKINEQKMEGKEKKEICIKDEAKYWITDVQRIFSRLFEQALIFIEKGKIVNYERLLSRNLLDISEIRYTDDLNKTEIPRKLGSADIFYYGKKRIFAVHGHMNSKTREKEDFCEYINEYKKQYKE